MVKESIRNNVLRIQSYLDHTLDVVKIRKVHCYAKCGVLAIQLRREI